MNEVLHANIFFVIASVATVVFCIFSCLILYHILKIVRLVRAIVERIEAGSGVIAEDVAQVRLWVRDNIFARVLGMMAGRRTRGTRKRADRNDDDGMSA